MKRKFFQKDLAAALNVSPSMVTKLKHQGMPTNSIAAARRWRESHLDPSLVKEIRGAFYPQNEKKTESSASVLISIAERLGLLAEKDFAAWQGDLREALREVARAVPYEERIEMVLPWPVWEMLTADARQALDAWAEIDGESPYAQEGEMSEEDQAYCGEFWFCIAIGWGHIKHPREFTSDQLSAIKTQLNEVAA